MQPTGIRRATALAGTAVLACLLLSPGRADAQQPDSVRIDTPYRWIPRGFRVGAAGGYLDTSLGNMRLGPGSSPVGGLRARVRISSPLSLEGSVLYGQSDRFVVDPRLDTGPAVVDTLSSRWLLAEAGIQFAVTGNRTWHGLQPYALVSGGFLVGLDEEASQVFAAPQLTDFRYDIEIMPAIQAGLGVEWLLGERFGLAVEARDHLWRISTPGDPDSGTGFFRQEVLDAIQDADAEAPRDTDWTHNLGFTLTIYRYF